MVANGKYAKKMGTSRSWPTVWTPSYAPPAMVVPEAVLDAAPTVRDNTIVVIAHVHHALVVDPTWIAASAPWGQRTLK